MRKRDLKRRAVKKPAVTSFSTTRTAIPHRRNISIPALNRNLAPATPATRSMSFPIIPKIRKAVPKKITKAKTKKELSALDDKSSTLFESPFFEAPIIEPVKEKPRKEIPIGIITHYFEKIKVGVIEVSKTLNEGDQIKVEGQGGDFEQEVKSMQHNHKTIKRAGKGKDVGLKLSKPPKLGGFVYKI